MPAIWAACAQDADGQSGATKAAAIDRAVAEAIAGGRRVERVVMFELQSVAERQSVRAPTAVGSDTFTRRHRTTKRVRRLGLAVADPGTAIAPQTRPREVAR